MPAPNERFHASGAVTPQTILYELARYYPAATAVDPPPAPSRWDVVGNVGGQLSGTVCKVYGRPFAW